MKTIIFVLTQQVNSALNVNTNYYWGLGDMFRGIVALYHISKRLNCEFIVDVSRHPIGALLKQKEHPFRNIIQESSIPYILPKHVDNYVQQSLKANDYVYLFTNCELSAFDSACDEELRSIITEVLTPNLEFEQYILQQNAKLPFSDFDIFHYRFPDTEFIKPCNNYNQFRLNVQTMNKGKNCVLLSNSSAFKDCVSDLNNVFAFKEKIAHTGVENDKTILQHTLYEFILLTKSAHIYTYNAYGWISGFVRIANYVYNIPLTVMHVQ